MTETINKLEELLCLGLETIPEVSEKEMSRKAAPEKWSKKEVLGHLIDSAINNLQRFTEIQYSPKPFSIRNYEQNELVIANGYQNVELIELVNLWGAINTQIINIIENQTENTLAYKIELKPNKIVDLRFLITDYVSHLEHHLNQIINLK